MTKRKIKKFDMSGIVASNVVNIPGAQNAAEYESAIEQDVRADNYLNSVQSQRINEVQVPQGAVMQRELAMQQPSPPPPPEKSNNWMGQMAGAVGMNAASSALQGMAQSSSAAGQSNQALIGATRKGAVGIAGATGALSGAASGAMKGASMGPIGMAIGAISGFVGGGIKGLLGGKKAKDSANKEMEAMAEQRKKEEEAMAQSMRNAGKSFSANRTANFMSQATSLYGKGGKQIAVARRGGIIYSPIHTLAYTNTIDIKQIDLPVTSKEVRKAYKGAKVEIKQEMDNTVVCSKDTGSCELMHKSESPIHQIVFRRGGSIVNKKKRNIIPHGVTHEEENQTGINGDKGIPIVKNGEKIFELEKSEWVLNSEVSNQIQKQVYNYLDTKDNSVLVDIGRTVPRELLLGTYSYDENYAHLNH